MSQPRVRLALLAAAAVVLAMVAATIVFNLFIGWKVESDAIADIKYGMEWSDEAGTGRVPSFLALDESYAIDEADRPWSAEEEVALAAWFARHPEEGTVVRVQLGDWACYAAIESVLFYDADAEDGWRRGPGGGSGSAAVVEDEPGYLVAYIDISGELSMIASVNATFAIIAVLGALLAALAGFAAGRGIERAQEAQKRFYENMSHELKTPLAAIRGYAEGADAGVVAVDDAVAAIGRETGKMTSTIDEMLGLSRLEAGAVELHREPVDVGDFAQDCLMPFEGAVRAKGLAVELDLAKGAVEADPGLFDHALSNVLSNAVRHAESTLRVTYDGARLAVFNDGDVPDADQLAHLFDRFYTGSGGSTGIGLAIAKEIATQHGWRIDARPVGNGLEVTFTF